MELNERYRIARYGAGWLDAMRGLRAASLSLDYRLGYRDARGFAQ